MNRWIDADEDVISREWILKEFDKGKPMLYQSEYFAELFWLVRHAPAVTLSLDLVRCAECKHLEVLNTWQLYARCQKFGIDFEPFETDTRTHGCSWGEREESE